MSRLLAEIFDRVFFANSLFGLVRLFRLFRHIWASGDDFLEVVEASLLDGVGTSNEGLGTVASMIPSVI